MDEVEPRCDRRAQPVQRATRFDRIEHRAEDSERQLLRAVPRDLRQQVTQRWIAKSPQHGLDVVGNVEATRRDEAGRDVLDHQAAHERRELRIPHRLRHGLVAGERAQIGERGMRAVQQAQLGALESGDVARDRHADRCPIGLRSAHAFLDHPLRERFALHGPPIDDAEPLGDDVAQRCISCRRDAVDHRARERHLVCDPACDAGIVLARELGDGTSQTRAVVGEVVAADDVRWRDSECVATSEPRVEMTDETAR